MKFRANISAYTVFKLGRWATLICRWYICTLHTYVVLTATSSRLWIAVGLCMTPVHWCSFTMWPYFHLDIPLRFSFTLCKSGPDGGGGGWIWWDTVSWRYPLVLTTSCLFASVFCRSRVAWPTFMRTNLAHLDIKPGNIFLCRRPNGPLASPASKGESSHFKFPISPPYPSSPSPVTIVSPGCSCCSSSSEESLPANCICIEKCVYKIGDLGHAMRTDLSSVSDSVCPVFSNFFLLL